MNPELKKNLSSGDHWVRALYVILFLLFAKVAGFLVALVAVVQVVFSLIAGQFNRQLLRFGDSLSQYLAAVFSFVVGKTEDKPFPFADWPASDIPAEEPAVDETVESATNTPEMATTNQPEQPVKADDSAADGEAEQAHGQSPLPQDNADDNLQNKPNT